MDMLHTWLAAIATLGVVVVYELWRALAQHRHPDRLARSMHASLREDWFSAVSQHPGSELLAVHTLRNSLMSATMIASTAVLGLMGTLTLAATSLQTTLEKTGAVWPSMTPRLAMGLVVLGLLFAALIAAVMAVRYYNHAGFVGGMPVGSALREKWEPAGRAYVRKAGVLYSWSLRQLLLVVPAVAFMLHPLGGLISAAPIVIVLVHFDRFHPTADGMPKLSL